MDAIILLALVLILLVLIYIIDRIQFVLRKMGEYEGGARNRHDILLNKFGDVIQSIALNRKAETQNTYPKSKLTPVVKTDIDLYEAEIGRGKK